jgi:hypothetical protein
MSIVLVLVVLFILFGGGAFFYGGGEGGQYPYRGFALPGLGGLLLILLVLYLFHVI